MLEKKAVAKKQPLRKRIPCKRTTLTSIPKNTRKKVLIKEEGNKLPQLGVDLRNFEIRISDTGINQEGFKELRKILQPLGINSVPYDFQVENKWMTDRGTYPKRLAIWIQKNYYKKLDEATLSKIGTVLLKYLEKEKVYYCTIHPGPFWWNFKQLSYDKREINKGKLYKGFFGDNSNSCWWSNTAYAYQGIAQCDWWHRMGGFALLIYDDKYRLCSDIGRGWICQYSKDLIVLGNCYVKGMAITQKFSKWIAEYITNNFGIEYKNKSVIVNNKQTAGSTYCVGLYDEAFIIGESKAIDNAPLKVVIGSSSEGDFKVRKPLDYKKYLNANTKARKEYLQTHRVINNANRTKSSSR